MHPQKLSKRLSTIVSLAESSGMTFYDICCDHGLIGLSIIVSKKAKKVIFNDQVNLICKELEEKIGAYITKVEHSIICTDARLLQLEKTNKKFIAIAGIGGDLLINIVKNLMDQVDENDIFLLSPHTKVHKVRKFLIENNFISTKEVLIEENDKFYEVLLVKKSDITNIELIGDLLWHENIDTSIKCLNEYIKYYQIKYKHSQDERIRLLLGKFIAMKNQLN